jgi:hypothetical protein
MPDLTIIAGCNGAGKSTFAPSFLPEGITSFDYDRVLSENYNSLPDSELREQFARHQTTEDFESAIEKAIVNKAGFCYETNFDAHPVYWSEKFKNELYTNLLQIEKGDIVLMTDQLPGYFKHRLPTIYQLVKTT